MGGRSESALKKENCKSKKNLDRYSAMLFGDIRSG